MKYKIKAYKSEIGKIYLVSDGKSLNGLYFESLWKELASDFKTSNLIDSGILHEATKQLDEYFAGKRKVFKLPIYVEGTIFQKKVWNVLKSIPYGQSKTYKEQAILVGSPSSARAVGTANGKNPISIIIPCHRIVGSNGSLTGYSGGIEIKKYLLEMEQKAK